MKLMSESHGWYPFHKEMKSWALQLGLEFDNFKPRLKGYILNAISAWMFRFLGGDDQGFLKEGVKTHLMAPMSTLFLSPHLYSLEMTRQHFLRFKKI